MTAGIQRDRATLGAFLLLVVLVGTNIVAIRLTNRELAPFWNAGFRFVLASLIFAVLASAHRASRPSRQEWIGASAYGVLAFGAFFAFVYLGLVEATAALGQTVLALGPLSTLLLAAAVGLERLRWRAVLGTLVSLAGIGVAFGAESDLDVPLASVLLLVAAATSFAAGSIVVKRLRSADPFVRNGIATGVGAAILLVLSAVGGEPWRLPATAPTWIAFIYLVIPGTVVIFLLFLYLIRRWPATRVSYQFILAPIVSITLGALLLDEPVGAGVVIGAGLVIAGVYLGALTE